ncbi:hypothetical protein [Leyella stercorea]|uniref:hypothetical protein n=1 Tax=Leyella stercorea TaxID=363265 RepID=UPI00266D7211|nr:hypothetical protein [Leyella stercorea]
MASCHTHAASKAARICSLKGSSHPQPQRQLASAASKAARVRMTCNVHEHGKMPCPPMVTLSASLGKYK